MVERFNGRIADVLKTHRVTSGEDLEQTLMRYVALYNHQLPQSALKSKTPMRAMKDWYASHPHLFVKRPYDHPGCDIYASPPLVARYRPVFWEPLPGTGERIVSMIAIEPHESSAEAVSAGTYCIIPSNRLRAMVGSQRGNAAANVLKRSAEFMTTRQQAGLPLHELEPLFRGFIVGPERIVRGYSIDQLLDAAVRSVAAFGNADELIDDEENKAKPRHTVRTSEFLNSIKRHVAGDNSELKERFDKSIKLDQNLPEMTVDYAHKQWLLQATSLPATARQATHAQRESQSKLYEIDMIRRHLDDNLVTPILMINTDALHINIDPQAKDEASAMLERLHKLAKAQKMDLIEVASSHQAAEIIASLN